MRLARPVPSGGLYSAFARFCFFSSVSQANQPVSPTFSSFTPYQFQTYHSGTSFRTQTRLRYSIPLTRSLPDSLASHIGCFVFVFVFVLLTRFVVQTIIHNYNGVVSLSLNASPYSLDSPSSLFCLHSPVFAPLSSFLFH
jgi:hypothetical protein